MKNDELIELLRRIDNKLGIILGNQITKEESNIRAQVERLSKSKMETAEIAQILGITPSHASKELSILRKVKKNAIKSEK